MTLTNEEIYGYARRIDEQFNQTINTLQLPVKVNFYLQKNIKAIMGPAQEIETARLELAQRYGTATEDGKGYKVEKENIPLVEKEMDDLLALEQDIQIYPIKLSSFDGVDLTYAQVDAISFMIEED